VKGSIQVEERLEYTTYITENIQTSEEIREALHK
jgi:hypothetical protein